MAYTPAGRSLTEAHRRAQSRIGSTLVAQILGAWDLVDIEDMDRSTRRWLRLVLPLVVAARLESIRTAQRYVAAFRAVEIPDAPPLTPPPPPVMDLERIRRSLIITGPGMLQGRVKAGDMPEVATRKAQVAVARAAQRQALDGGRGRILDIVQADRSAFGWARATSGSCCYFCAMLAARGGVYKTERTAGFDPHDGCNCEPEPMYRKAQPLPAGSERFQELWKDSTEGLSRHDARLAFRRAYEGRDAPEGWEPGRASTRARPPLPGKAGSTKATHVDRVARAKAERKSLEAAHEELLRRQAAGEDVAQPIKWQRERIAKLDAVIRGN